MRSPFAAPVHTLPKAAQAILALPGVESLEREPDGWCCHLSHGWTTDALGGGGTIIDSNLKVIRSFVIGAYCTPEADETAQAQAEAPHPCSAEGVAAEALAALAELGATPEPTPAPQAEALTEAQEDLALALAWEDLSPEALQGAQEDLALALAEPTPRPCLPGEALPPAPPAWGGPAPELPTLRPLRTPAELRADADSLQAEAAQALQALATIPALRRSAPDIRSMAQQLGDQAARLRGVAAAREAQAQARPLAPELPPLA